MGKIGILADFMRIVLVVPVDELFKFGYSLTRKTVYCLSSH
jgi:hypothetical protein